jgi:hypothetical protein
VLPVSLTVVPPDDEEDEEDAEDDVEGEELELLQAASKASGTIAAAVHTKRILLATEEYSLGWVFRTLTRAVWDSHADACDEARASAVAALARRAGAIPHAGGSSA